jgi:hypothetical protein
VRKKIPLNRKTNIFRRDYIMCHKRIWDLFTPFTCNARLFICNMNVFFPFDLFMVYIYQNIGNSWELWNNTHKYFGTAYPWWTPGFTPQGFYEVHVTHLLSFLCCIVFLICFVCYVLFVFVLCLVCLRPVSCLSSSCVLFVFVLCLVCLILPVFRFWMFDYSFHFL